MYSGDLCIARKRRCDGLPPPIPSPSFTVFQTSNVPTPTSPTAATASVRYPFLSAGDPVKSCSYCTAHGTVCQFTREVKKRGPKKKSDKAALRAEKDGSAETADKERTLGSTSKIGPADPGERQREESAWSVGSSASLVDGARSLAIGATEDDSTMDGLGRGWLVIPWDRSDV